MVVGLGLALGCGDTSKPTGTGSSVCPKDDCPERCEPTRKFCHERQIWECNDQGDEATIVQSCSADEQCREQGDAAACESACFAGQAICEGDVATRCRADGSGPEPGGQDCGATEQVCEQGACVEASCVPGQRLCRDGDVVLCAASGNSVSLVNDCKKDDRICHPELLICALRVCEAGQLGCDQTRVRKCNDVGTRWNETDMDCATQNQVCAAGQCKDPTCVPGAVQCIDNSLYSCNLDGLTLTLSLACDSNQHCVEINSSEAGCYTNDCLAGFDVCHGNTLKTCNADGTFPADGTDCGDEVCEAGACLPKVCEVGKSSCKDGNVYSCPGRGVRIEISQQCPAETSCALLGTNLDCVARLCKPGAAEACVANSIGQCKADGHGLVAATKNCESSGDVCSSAGACIKTAVDTLGLAQEVEPLSNNEIVGNVIDVHSKRRLTKLEANLLLDVPRDLRWVLYEWSGTEFVALLSDITANQVGSGFFSSAALDYDLLPGKRYLLAVTLVIGEGYVYYDTPPQERSLSFGYAVNGNRSSYAATTFLQSNTNLYRLRVTTELP